MSNDDQEETSTEDREDTSTEDREDTSSKDSDDKEKADGENIELSEEGKENVKQMAAAYEDRETAILPGTGRTITGTAVNEWLDDEGNPKFGKEEQQKREQEQEKEPEKDE